jgi:hypothetical protein
MENLPEGGSGGRDRAPAAGQIITGIGGVWGKNFRAR